MESKQSPQVVFVQLWHAAARDYANIVGFALDDENIPQVDSIDHLLDVLSEGDEDFRLTRHRPKGVAFTATLKAVVGPVELITKVFGGAAEAAFPPSKQILGALSVLINAGKAVTDSFDAIVGLFKDIIAFTRELKPILNVNIPEDLRKILIGVMVSMLSIMALATRRSHQLAGQDSKHPHLHKVLQKTRTIRMTAGEYIQMLLYGEDHRIKDAISELQQLLKEEQRYVTALIYDNSSFTKNIAIDIEGLTLNIKKVEEEIAFSVKEIKSAQTEVLRNTSETKEYTKEIKDDVRELKRLFSPHSGRGFDFINGEKNAGAAKSGSQTKQEKPMKSWLKDFMNPASDNTTYYDSVKWLPNTTDWILKRCDPLNEWLEHRFAILCINGETGTGKTVLARRILEHISSQQKQPEEVAAYFFCRKDRSSQESTNKLLRSLAFQVAQADQEYKKYLKRAASEGWLTNDEDSGEMKAKPAVIDSAAQDMPKLRLGPTIAKPSPSSNNDPSLEGSANERGAADETADYDPGIPDGDRKVQEMVQDQAVSDLWRVLFHDYFTNANPNVKDGRVCLVIDALERCGEPGRNSLIKAINSTVTTPTFSGRLQILLVTSPETKETVDSVFDPDSIKIVEPHLHNEADVKNFVIQKLKESWSKRLVSHSLFTTAADVISSHSQGNFMWARLVIDEVTSHVREDVILSSLESLPTDLTEAMKLVLKRLDRELDEHSKKDLEDILAWVSTSYWDLSLAQLDSILVARSSRGARIIDLENRIRHEFSSIFIVSPELDSEEAAREDGRKLDSVRAGTNIDLLGLSSFGGESQESSHDTDSGGDTDTSIHTAESLDKNVLSWRLKLLESTEVTIRQAFPLQNIQEQQRPDGERGFTSARMKETVLIGCLDILCDKREQGEVDELKLGRQYCALYLPEHLQDVDASRSNSSTKMRVARRLMELFQDDVLLERWVSIAQDYMVDDLLVDERFCNRALSWFEEVTSFADQLTSAEQNWITAFKESPHETLFGQLVKVHAQRWLQFRLDEVEKDFPFIHAYLVKTGHALPGHLNDPDDFSLEKCDPDRIIEIARWAGFSQNGMWFTRLGAALRDAGHLHEAVDHCTKAIEIQPGIAIYETSLGIVYSQMGRSQDAMSTMESALLRFEQNLADKLDSGDPNSTLWSYFLDHVWRLASIYEEAGKENDRIAAYQKALISWENTKADEDFSAICIIAVECFGLLITSDREDEAVTLFERILRHPLSDQKPFLKMYMMLLTNYDIYLRRLIRRTGRVELLDRMYFDVWKVVKRHGSIEQINEYRFSRALTMIRFHRDMRSQATEILKSIIGGAENPDEERAWWLTGAQGELARIYMDQILHMKEEDDWKNVGAYSDVLVRLLRSDEGEMRLKSSRMRICTAVVAACYRENGKLDRARQCVIGFLNHGIEWLSDTDPENDSSAWYWIADAMLAIGDYPRAIASVNMINHVRMFGVDEEDEQDDRKTEEKDNKQDKQHEQEQKHHSEDGNNTSERNEPKATDPQTNDTTQSPNGESPSHPSSPQPEGSQADPNGEPEVPEPNSSDGKADPPTDPASKPVSPFFTCDGPCFKSIPSRDTMWRCSHCITDFCGDCHTRIKAGEDLGWGICGRLHHHVEMPGVTERFPRRHIRVGEGKFVPVEEWLGEVKREWGVV